MSAVRVRVPATSANLGPGFDALGLALAMYDVVEVAETGSGLEVTVSGQGATELPRDERHLLVRALRTALETTGHRVGGLALLAGNEIPQGRGLGSSAAAIVAGVVAGNALAGGVLDQPAVLRLCAELEGHPDNVAACLLGGLTLSWTGRYGVRAIRLPLAAHLPMVLAVPPRGVPTELARRLLPDQVPHRDAARNAARAALLVAALGGQPEVLLDATEDRLHQPYRAAAMPEAAALVEALRGEGVAAVISGAGPTVLALGAGAAPVAALAPPEWRVLTPGVDLTGATWERLG